MSQDEQEQWLRSHVERCLQDNWDLCRVQTDDDGDYPFRAGTSACWVQLEQGLSPASVAVFAHAATDVPGTVKVLREVNEVACAARFVSVFWCGGAVIVRRLILAADVDRASLEHTCEAVAAVAGDIGPMFASVFGGDTPFPASEQPSEGDAA